MNQERINEIERFAEEFFRKLDDAHSNYEKNSLLNKSVNKEAKQNEKPKPKKKLFVRFYDEIV